MVEYMSEYMLECMSGGQSTQSQQLLTLPDSYTLRHRVFLLIEDGFTIDISLYLHTCMYVYTKVRQILTLNEIGRCSRH